MEPKKNNVRKPVVNTKKTGKGAKNKNFSRYANGTAEDPSVSWTKLLEENQEAIANVLAKLHDILERELTEEEHRGLRARFFKDYEESDRRLLVLRFLRLTHFSEEKAVAAILSTVEFRRSQSIDRMAVFPSLIPTRGYNEHAVCEALDIPYVSGDREESGGVVLSGSNIRRHRQSEATAVLAPEPGVLRPGDSGADFGYYDVEYTQLYGGVTTEQQPEVGQDPKATAAQRASDTHRRGQGSAGGGITGFVGRALHFRNRSSAAASHRNDDAPSTEESVSAREVSSAHGAASSLGSSLAGSCVSLYHEAEDGAIITEGDVTRASAAPSPSNQNAAYLNFHALLRPIIDRVTGSIPLCVHYWDRRGRPVLYLKLGLLNSKEFFESLTDFAPVGTSAKAVMILFYVYVQEVLAQLVRYSNWKKRRDSEIQRAFASDIRRESSRQQQEADVYRHVTDILMVVDCKKVKVNHFLYKPLLSLVKALIHINSRYYPYTLHRIHIVNCNSAVNIGYMHIRNTLPEGTRRRVLISSPEVTYAALCNDVDPQYIPEEFGGQCACPHGCVPITFNPNPDGGSGAFSDSDSSASVSTSVSGASGGWNRGGTAVDAKGHRYRSAFLPDNCRSNVERFRVKAKRHKQISLSLNKGEDVIWDFKVKRKRRAKFTATFYGADTVAAFVPLRNGVVVHNDAFHYVCPSIGTLVLEWKNSKHFFRSIQIHLKVFYINQARGASGERNDSQQFGSQASQASQV